MNLPVLVLAGGRGERMRPLTDHMPKCLLPIAGKPFAVRQVEWLHKQGLTDITFSLDYLGEQAVIALEAYIAEDLKYIYGSGGLQRAIYTANMQEPFYLLYGDVLPQYTAHDLWNVWFLDGLYSVMGKCDTYYDTGFSLIHPAMESIEFIDVPPSLEIGSPEGYAAMRRYFGETVP